MTFKGNLHDVIIEPSGWANTRPPFTVYPQIKDYHDMKVSTLPQWLFQSFYVASLYYVVPVAATVSDRMSTPGALRDKQYIIAEPEVEVCEGENVSFIVNMTIPADLTPDRLYERTVWSPDKKNHCFIYGNISKCHGEDFVLRAEISNSWSVAVPGELTKHGQLKFQLNNVSLADAGYYEPELKTAYNINNVNVMLTVKDPSACQQKPHGGDTDGNKDPEVERRRGFDTGFGAGFGACLGLVIMGGLAAAIWRYRTKDEKPPVGPV